MFLEALKPHLSIQSYMPGFAGTASNGYITLKESKENAKVLFQLHPNDSIFIGSKTFSISPKSALTDSHPASSEPGAYVDETIVPLDPLDLPESPERLKLSPQDPLIPQSIVATSEELEQNVLKPTGCFDSGPQFSQPRMKRCSVLDEAADLDQIGVELTGSSPMPALASHSPVDNPQVHHSISREVDSRKEETQDSLKSTIEVRKGASDKGAPALTKLDEPTSSSRSSQPDSRRREESFTGQATQSMRVLFANSTRVEASDKKMRFLKLKGVQVVSAVDQCTHLCISQESGLRRTSKLILAVLLGKEIITDVWVEKCLATKALQDPNDFIAGDVQRESEWGICLKEAVERGKNRPRPFGDWKIAFTPAAKKVAGKGGLIELQEIIQVGGGELPSTAFSKMKPSESDSTLIIATPDDPALAKLGGAWRCFTQDIITFSALRGRLDISSDEFLVAAKSEGKHKRKR